jgi:Tol biopolymer transport system component
MPAWSPDGREIVFASNRAKPKSAIDQLYVMGRSGGPVRRLTHNGIDAREPSFSPGGTKIVYAANVLDRANDFTSAGRIAVLNLRSGVTHYLPHVRGDAGSPAWSPDGRWLAFLDTVPTFYGSDSRTDLYVAHPDGTDLHKLVRDIDGWSYAWSPDSKKIAVGAGGSLYLARVDSTRTIRTSTGTSGILTDISWSPDGSEIAFVHGEFVLDGSGDIYPRALWIRKLGSGRPFRLRTVPDSESLGSFAVTIVWLDGRGPRLDVFGYGRTYLLNPNFGHKGRVDRVWPTSSTSAELSSGSASPDGKRILLVDGPYNSYLSAIYLATVNGHKLRQLTQTGS